jgi:hypothetical protein
MRKPVFALVAILCVASPSVGAPIGIPAAGRPAFDAFKRAERVACWGYGWRGYGWYSELNVACWGAALLGGPYVDPPIYAVPRIAGPPPYVPPFDGVQRCWIPDNGPNGGRWRVC